MLFRTVVILLVFLLASGCKTLEEQSNQVMSEVRKGFSDAFLELKRTKIVNDPEFQRDWQDAKRGFRDLLAKLNLDDYEYQHLGDADKRFIKLDKDGREIETRTGRKVVSSHRNEQKYAPLITLSAQKYGVPEARIYAVIRAESGFNPKAVSSAGAMGLMQLMPETAKELGVKRPFSPMQNIEGGTRYLAALNAQYGNWKLTHAAYNAGPGNVKKYGGKVPPFKETQMYISRVNRFYRYYRKGSGMASLQDTARQTARLKTAALSSLF